MHGLTKMRQFGYTIMTLRSKKQLQMEFILLVRLEIQKELLHRLLILLLRILERLRYPILGNLMVQVFSFGQALLGPVLTQLLRLNMEKVQLWQGLLL